MDIQNLSAFISVSETGSFSKAAEKLHLTQPAVSKRISTLERQLDASLFDRIGKKVRLTEAGQALLPGAQRILAELDESRRAISNLSGHIGGSLRLGTSHHIGLHRLPPVLRNYTALYPDVDLDIQFMDSEAACEAVLKGELELAIATLPEQPIDKLSENIIWHDPLGIVVGKNHDLADEKRVDLNMLMQQPAILPSQSTFTRALLEQAFGLDTGKLNIAMETNYLETIKMMVSIGLGWSVLPVSMLDEELISIEIEGIKMERLLGAVYHSGRTLSNAGKMLLKLLQTNK
ncbi:MAG: LysR family transcriptional regulator [Gammaproteobacteria bacterium]|nr:LysR family transcriptional regulator [Gammaproteobacteria bacterium]